MGAFFHELFRVGLYKRNQGRIARQLTAAAVAIVIGIGAWRLSEWFIGNMDRDYEGWVQTLLQYGLPLALALFGLWSAYRLVNIPAFADFLISVEAEMNKVSWPQRPELYRASIVVMCVIFILAFVLYFYDFIWRTLLRFLSIIQ